ncbi:hypothetical protein ACJ41O_013849 [Fusarium nematophilum]
MHQCFAALTPDEVSLNVAPWCDQGWGTKSLHISGSVPFLEQKLEELKEDIEFNEPELKQDKASEKRRREMMDKETEGQSIAGMLWSYYWSDVAERRRRAQWDREVGERTRKLEEQTRESKEHKEKIRKLNHELKRLELRREQFEDGTTDDDPADKHENGIESKIRQLQGVAEKNRSEVKRLKAELDEFEFEMRRIKKYEAIVPDLCYELGEMEENVKRLRLLGHGATGTARRNCGIYKPFVMLKSDDTAGRKLLPFNEMRKAATPDNKAGS